MTTAPKRAKFTKGYVDKVRPAAKDDFHWDTDVKGFGLRITPNGKVTFVVQGRVEGSGKEARITIGAYGVFTVDQARDMAREHLRTMRKGGDPRANKKQDKAMKVTLRQVADAYFDRPGQPLRESTKAEMNRHIDRVLAKWADKPIASITIDDCRQRHREMCESGLDGRPAPGQAQISLVTLRTLINFANRRYPRADGSPLIPVNPVKAMAQDNWKPFEPRDRHIELHNIGKAWYALDEMRLAPKNTDALAAIDVVRFLLLTGARRSEAAALTWDRVHFDEDATNCWWHLREQDNKTGNPIWLPLSSQAVALLKARRKLADDAVKLGKPSTPFVFPSRSKVGHVTDARAPFETLRKAIGMDGLSSHDLRRTHVTVGFSACNVELFKMELLTNHVPEGVTARHYLQTSRLQYLHPETQRISDYIEREGQVARDKATGGNVVALKRA
ncbi:tyrosine-type recombinase/integrase [Sphingomonas faeni]|uniref:tyrosine-type recombinase/integrase n=1 Tax=Sphingomonas faeni TaxID=185950 RepID=UPI0033602063